MQGQIEEMVKQSAAEAERGTIMRCPSLEELTPPPPGRTGWPWTEASRALPDCMADGSEWPKISIVTSSYNYERYLEATMRSVLLQGYPNVEFIIQDDGSSDGS